MDLAIIGTGNVGAALGGKWAAGGHRVVFGTRDPGSAKARDLLDAVGGNAQVATPVEAAAGAEVVVLATPWGATGATVGSLGELERKTSKKADAPGSHSRRTEPSLSFVALSSLITPGPAAESRSRCGTPAGCRM